MLDRLKFFSISRYRLSGMILSETKAWYWDDSLTLILPVFMLASGNSAMTINGVANVLSHWFVIIFIGSFAYTVFALNNGHHGPNIIHEGDEIESLDFGAFQIRAIVDRAAVDGNDFTVLAYFGQHVLHHLFPTLDHCILHHLEAIYIKTCDEFSIVPNKKTTMIDSISNQFKQLARSTTTKLKISP
jgi:fatty acid desaturase